MAKRLHPVILAGGSGTRFWPLSRRKLPKQLLPLASKKPLVQETFERVLPLAPPSQTLVVCGAAHAKPIGRLLKKLPAKNVLVEPAPRNTAPAIGLAALVALAKDPDAILVVLPSDHAVDDDKGFAATVQIAAAAAEQGALVVIGVRPTRAETGYGYVKVGEAYARERRAKKVLAFVEKPDRVKAESYFGAGDYLWNAGMFVFRADRILEELRAHLPAAAKALDAIAPTVGTKGFEKAVAKHFPAAPSISIDYAVMEKAHEIAVVPAEFGWSDLGSFGSIPDVRAADAEGNVVEGDALLLDANGNLVIGHADRKIVLIGVDDLVVVDAGDALLVCRRDNSQEVRKAVEALEESGDEQLL